MPRSGIAHHFNASKKERGTTANVDVAKRHRTRSLLERGQGREVQTQKKQHLQRQQQRRK
jgi:hypothetical protein